MADISPKDLAQYIDHTLLKPDAQKEEIENLCQEAIDYQFKGVCVSLAFLPLVVELLKETEVLPITVIGFPGGDEPSMIKVKEAKRALLLGAKEIDMVQNNTFLKNKDYCSFYRDVQSVVTAVSIPVKVILETCLLSDEEMIISCALAKAAGAAYVKTSTGFGSSGAKQKDVALMRKIVGADIGVKASGGIRTYAVARQMVEAGADRLGTSASVAIIEGK